MKKTVGSDGFVGDEAEKRRVIAFGDPAASHAT